MGDSAAGLKFIVVGASVSGLASAISLKKSGHSVVVLEKDSELGGAGSGLNGCARIGPNGHKILRDWGLEVEIGTKVGVMPGFAFYKYAAREELEADFLADTRFNEELLLEARGGYMQFRHQDLIDILYKEAKKTSESDSSARISVLFGAEVTNIDSTACSVTLRSGEIHTGDIIIGADGGRGVVRQTLMQAENAPLENDVSLGLAVHSTVIPKALVEQTDLASFFYDAAGITWSSVWLGANRGAAILPVGEANDLAFGVYTPDSAEDGAWTERAAQKLSDVVGQCDARLQKLAGLAGAGTCVQIKEPYRLKSWVSESGRVLALGEAAHPSLPGGLHPYSVALEDAVFIGKIFSHTRNHDRIPEFLHAFQEHREPRCSRLRAMDLEYVQATTLPAGEIHDQRDAGMRANHAAGLDAMAGNFQQMLEDFVMVFGYDAMDDADEWWINWGRFRDTGITDAV